MAVIIDSARPTQTTTMAGGRVRLRTLIVIRWVAIIGQALALLVVNFGFGYPVPLLAALATVAVSAVINFWAAIGRRSPERLGDRAAAIYLAYDLLQLGVLLYLTGGLHNPFAVLVLAPVIISATVLSRVSTMALSVLAAGDRDRAGALPSPVALGRPVLRPGPAVHLRVGAGALPVGGVHRRLCVQRGRGGAPHVGRAGGQLPRARPRTAGIGAGRPGGGGGASAGQSARHHCRDRQGAGARPAAGQPATGRMSTCC